jgi:hypothetical protein
MVKAGGPRAIALGALALAVGAGLWQLPFAFRGVVEDVRGLQAESALERRSAGARGVDIDMRVFVEAERLIPADARYAVVTGPNVRVGNPVTLDAVPPFAGNWLLPRRRVLDPAEADWVLSYGGDLAALGLGYSRIVEITEGIELGQVRRPDA